jgi:hypothetical protein
MMNGESLHILLGIRWFDIVGLRNVRMSNDEMQAFDEKQKQLEEAEDAKERIGYEERRLMNQRAEEALQERVRQMEAERKAQPSMLETSKRISVARPRKGGGLKRKADI